MASKSSGSMNRAAQPPAGLQQARATGGGGGQAQAPTHAAAAASSAAADNPSPAQPAPAAADDAQKATRTGRDAWSADADRALVASVKERGTRQWALVVKDLEQKGTKRTSNAAEHRYFLLKSRAEAQGVPLDGPVKLNDWTIDEEARLLAVSQLVDEGAASHGKTRQSIIWSKFSSAFPGRGAIDLSQQLGGLKQLLKGNSRNPSRVNELKRKKEEELEKLKTQFPELAEAATKASGGTTEPEKKKSDTGQASVVARESPAVDIASRSTSASRAPPSPFSSFSPSTPTFPYSAFTSQFTPSSSLSANRLAASPTSMAFQGELGRPTFSSSLGYLPPKQPTYPASQSQHPYDPYYPSSSSAAPAFQPHRNFSSSSSALAAPSFAYNSAVPRRPPATAQKTSQQSTSQAAKTARKRARQTDKIIEEAKRLCRRAAEALSEEIEDW
ncbi:hypothetical protein JCM10213_002318 [Rhodosporidiobolus nylandii]